MIAKIEKVGINFLISDYENMLEDESLRMIQGALRLSSKTPDSKYIISGSWDKTIKIWDINKGECINTLKGHTSYVNAISITFDGKYIVSASRDYNLIIWDFCKGVEIARFTADYPLITCAVSPNGKTIFAGDKSGRLHFLKFVGI